MEYDALRLQLKTGVLSLGGFFNFVSESLIEGHILKEDMKFFDYMKSHKSWLDRGAFPLYNKGINQQGN